MLRAFFFCLASFALAGCQGAYFAAVNAGASPVGHAAFGPDPLQPHDGYAPGAAAGAPVEVDV
jgi:hypothetical protein